PAPYSAPSPNTSYSPCHRPRRTAPPHTPFPTWPTSPCANTARSPWPQPSRPPSPATSKAASPSPPARPSTPTPATSTASPATATAASTATPSSTPKKNTPGSAPPTTPSTSSSTLLSTPLYPQRRTSRERAPATSGRPLAILGRTLRVHPRAGHRALPDPLCTDRHVRRGRRHQPRRSRPGPLPGPAAHRARGPARRPAHRLPHRRRRLPQGPHRRHQPRQQQRRRRHHPPPLPVRRGVRRRRHRSRPDHPPPRRRPDPPPLGALPGPPLLRPRRAVPPTPPRRRPRRRTPHPGSAQPHRAAHRGQRRTTNRNDLRGIPPRTATTRRPIRTTRAGRRHRRQRRAGELRPARPQPHQPPPPPHPATGAPLPDRPPTHPDTAPHRLRPPRGKRMNDHPALARIRLNPHSRDVQRDLRDATQMHRTVMRMVPDNLGDAPRQQTGLLYRLEETDTSSTLLVQAAQLDPARLPDDYGQADIKSLTPMFSALRKGLGVRYRIVLNPAKRERLPLQ